MVKRRTPVPNQNAPKDAGRLGIRLGEDVRKALEDLAAEDGRDLSGYVRWVLTQHVKAASRKRGA